MTTYLKTPNSYVSYVCPETRLDISPRKIVAAEKLSKDMKKRIHEGGLIECTKEEYEAQQVASMPEAPAPEAPPAEEKAPEQAPLAEPPAEEAPPAETKPVFKGFGKGKKK